MPEPKEILQTITWGNLYFDEAPPQDNELPDDSPYFGAYQKWALIIEFIKRKCEIVSDRIFDLKIHRMEFLAVDETFELFHNLTLNGENRNSCELFMYEDRSDRNRIGFLWIPKETWADIQFLSKENAESCPECPDWNPDELWKGIEL